jgi:Domain of unknown function (DUF5710)
MRVELLGLTYEQNDEAKSLGARWDGQEKVWYVSQPFSWARCRRWFDPLCSEEERNTMPEMEPPPQGVWVDVQKDHWKAAKRRGYIYHKDHGCYYNPAG